MELFQYYTWYSIFSLFLFCFIDLKLCQFVWFLTIMQILCVNYMHIKGKRIQMWKHIMTHLVLIQWKCVCNTKQEWRLIIEFKNIRSVFLGNNCDLHSLKVLHSNWCSVHYMCIMKKETIERSRVPKEKRCTILFNVLFFLYR
jgi:hypothetical protein